LSLILLGFGKKLLLADRLGAMVDPVFNQPQGHSLPIWLLSIFLFGFQIYCDFSGYSDIARGVSRLFGVELMHNFRQPYLASGFKDFWSRWHISLSGWFRDYVYIPLGGSHVGLGRSLLNLMLVFCLSGLWHGANLTFLIWGAWHGTGLVAERVLLPKNVRSRIWALFSLTWIWLGWFWFRLNHLSDLDLIFSSIQDTAFQLSELKLSGSWSELGLALLGIGTLWLLESRWTWLATTWSATQPALRWSLLSSGCILLLWLGMFKGQAFIYFQF
jgi:D-alanyl-lipoteichoic acid acyltransferase DltB (MBOAT superfamily)